MKERPRCRKMIERLCADYDWSLTELYEFSRYDPECIDWRPVFMLSFSVGPKAQLKKMMLEEDFGVE